MLVVDCDYFGYYLSIVEFDFYDVVMVNF